MGRRIHEAKIKFISLVPRGANRLPVIYKDDGAFDIDMLLKASDTFMEKGELLAVVYAPESRDSQGDIASAEVVKDMMYDAAKTGLNIDIRHDEKAITKEQAYVAESFLIQKNDPRFHGFKDYNEKPVDVTGAWGVVIKVDDPKLRTLYKEGKWNGVSMGGHAKVSTEKNDDLADQIVNKLAHRLSNLGDIEMTKTEVEEITKAAIAGVVPTIVAEVTKALKPAEKEVKKDETPADDGSLKAPVFKGDFSNIADVKKHSEAMKRFNLAKSVDFNNPESVEKYEKALEELNKSTPAKKADDESDEVKELKEKLAKAQKRSNQGAGAADQSVQKDEDANTEMSGISKEDAECIAMGRKMAKITSGS